MNYELEEGPSLELDFSKLEQVAATSQNLIPVAVQDIKTKEVLIIAYTNKTAFDYTIKTKTVAFWSSSRNELWLKGKTSGDTLKLIEARVNCEQNSLLYLVELQGSGSCHTKDQITGKARTSCFYRKINNNKQLDFI